MDKIGNIRANLTFMNSSLEFMLKLGLNFSFETYIKKANWVKGNVKKLIGSRLEC